MGFSELGSDSFPFLALEVAYPITDYKSVHEECQQYQENARNEKNPNLSQEEEVDQRDSDNDQASQ